MFPGCRFGRCVCLMVAALVYACVPSCLFNRCLCSLVAVLVGMSSSRILLYWAPAPEKGRINAQMTSSSRAPAPDKGAYQNSSHIFFGWPPIRGRIKTQATSSFTGPRPPIRGRLQSQATSSLTGPQPPRRCVLRLQPYRPLTGPRYGGLSKLNPRPPSLGPGRR